MHLSLVPLQNVVFPFAFNAIDADGAVLTTANQGGAIPADIQGTHPVLVSLESGGSEYVAPHPRRKMVLSCPPLNRYLPLGLKVTARTQLLCPSICPKQRPSARSQRRMTLSLLTLANRVLLGQAATQPYPGLMAINLVELVSRRQMPDP